MTGADLLDERVPPFMEHHGLPLFHVLTDCVSEGNTERPHQGAVVLTAPPMQTVLDAVAPESFFVIDRIS